MCWTWWICGLSWPYWLFTNSSLTTSSSTTMSYPSSGPSIASSGSPIFKKKTIQIQILQVEALFFKYFVNLPYTIKMCHFLTFSFAICLFGFHKECSRYFEFIQHSVSCLQNWSIGNSFSSQNPYRFYSGKNINFLIFCVFWMKEDSFFHTSVSNWTCQRIAWPNNRICIIISIQDVQSCIVADWQSGVFDRECCAVTFGCLIQNTRNDSLDICTEFKLGFDIA